MDFEKLSKHELKSFEQEAEELAIEEATNMDLAIALISVVSTIVFLIGLYFLLKNRGSLCKKKTGHDDEKDEEK